MSGGTRLGTLLALTALGVAAAGCARTAETPLRIAAKPLPRFGKLPGAPNPRSWAEPARPADSAEVIAVEAGVAGDRTAALLEVPADSCAVVIARATGSVEDLDLLAYGEDGAVLGTDEGPDKTPALLICPPHPGRIYVAARIASGHGLVALGAEPISSTQQELAAYMQVQTEKMRKAVQESGAQLD